MTPAVAARVRQLAAQAEHRRAIAEYRARRAADQQARVNALLLEAVAALASLLGAERHGQPRPQPPRAASRSRRAAHGASGAPTGQPASPRPADT
jgi:plasmid stabilization system protein ParE